jgi:signal transduction histidine kinase
MAAKKLHPNGTPEQAAFAVDTQLFRELGELLVGRDATALLELVKNSYDADATLVTVHGERVASKRGGVVIVSDDGNGMTLAEFRDGFLRLAGRGKNAGERRSRRYGRRYTGEKGVGRLATHKLARVIEVDSIPWSARSGGRRGVNARIDWRQVERHRTLDAAAKAIDLSSYTPPRTAANGTIISLSNLRHPWQEEELVEFVAAAEAFSPPRALVSPAALLARLDGKPLLFREPKVRDRTGARKDPGFAINLAGDFAFAEAHWDELVESVEWVLEIDARSDVVRFCVTPTERELKNTAGNARRQTFEASHPDPDLGPFFQARVFARQRLSGSVSFRDWSPKVAGIRVYSEGFRVLPYGEPENDWLAINRDYAARRRTLRLIDENRRLAEQVGWTEEEDLGLTLQPSDSYAGAVFLLREHSGGLEMLVNREGFVPNVAFENLRVLTRLGIDLLTRARAAGREQKREQAKAAKAAREAAERAGEERDSADPVSPEAEGPGSWTEEVRDGLEGTRAEIAHLRASMAAGDIGAAHAELERLEAETHRLAAAINALVAEQRLTPVLASVGIQMSEFVHEINGLLAITTTVETVLGNLREEPANFTNAAARKKVAETHQGVRELRARLERQTSYLVDLTSRGAVRRRSRQRLAERVERVGELVRPALQRNAITLSNRVASELRTPPMFPAELTAVLLNLLTNAVKAAGEHGRVLVRAGTPGRDGSLTLKIENTGEPVELEGSERWFRPFETTTTEVDPLLGQGMGFGLPITRGILEEYGADIEFVPPNKGYATAIRVRFP